MSYAMTSIDAEVPPDWRNKMIAISPRDLQLGDRVLLPRAYKMAMPPSAFVPRKPELPPVEGEYLSGPISWMTDMKSFRSGYGINGAMKVCLTDNDVPVEIVYDFYGIDFVTVYVYLEPTEPDAAA